MRKLDMDLAVSRGMCGSMSGEPDDDILDLSRELCTRAGMLLEEASAIVVTVGDGQRDELLLAIQEACDLIKKAIAFLSAAEAMVRD